MNGDYQVFTWRYDGWPRSGFKQKLVALQVRRVDAEAQLEISIEQQKGERWFTDSASLTLSAADISRLIGALSGAAEAAEKGRP